MATKAHIYYCWSIDTTQTLTLNALEAIIQTVIPKETIQNPKTKSSMEPTKTSVFSVVCRNWAFFSKPYHVQTDGGQYWRELSYWIFFIGSGRHAAFRKYVNGDNRLTQLFFTRMGNLVKMGKSAGGGWLPFWKVLAGKVSRYINIPWHAAEQPRFHPTRQLFFMAMQRYITNEVYGTR